MAGAEGHNAACSHCANCQRASNDKDLLSLRRNRGSGGMGNHGGPMNGTRIERRAIMAIAVGLEEE